MEKTKCRVYFVADGVCYLCDAQSNSIELATIPERQLRDRIIDGAVEILQEEKTIVDFSNLSEHQRSEYEKRAEFITKVEELFGPTYLEIKRNKEFSISSLAKEYGISLSTAWRYIRRYLQSGCNMTSLVQIQKKSPNRVRNYKKKTGRPTEFPIGKVLTEEDRENFEKYRLWMMKNKYRSMHAAYIEMCNECYYEIGVDGRKHRLSPTQVPTYRQFEYYCQCHTTQKEKLEKKLGAEEARNSERIFTGESRTNIIRFGQLMEIDAVEADVSLVSADRMHTVGRGIMYLGVDVATTAITAFTAGFENNSYEGLSGLFLSLLHDYNELKEKYGLDDFLPDDIPTHYIPESVRCDGGSEVQGNAFSDFCKRRRIRTETPPPRTGSLKGVIESRFHLFQKDFRPYLVDKGLITNDYNSSHHKEAVMTIHDFRTMMLLFIIYHNRTILTGYKRTPEQINEKLKPSPKNLYKYLIEKEGLPKQITDKNSTQFLWDLMIEGKASISKKGVKFKDLDYMNDDPALHELMRQKGGKVKKMSVRYDAADCSAIYYEAEGALMCLPLNMNIHSSREYAGKPFKEVEMYKKMEKTLRKMESVKNEENFFDKVEAEKQLLKRIPKRRTDATDDNIKEYRREEKFRTTNENSITRELIQEQAKLPLQKEEQSKEPTGEDFSAFIPCESIEEAILGEYDED